MSAATASASREATTTFDDDLSMTMPDPVHSVGEERFILLGRTNRGRLVVVVFTDRDADLPSIRLISARLADQGERYDYEEGPPWKRRAEPFAEFKMIAPVWAEYERRLVAISDDRKAAALARSYVDSLRPPYEWEGYHEGPEAEARFADAYRMKHPDSPFRELLPLLAAHRWACTEEAYTYESNPAAAARSDTSFLRALAVATNSSNPLVRVAGEHLRRTHSCDTAR